MYALEDPIGDTVLQSGGLVQRFEFVEHGLRYYRLLRCTRADKIPEFRFTHCADAGQPHQNAKRQLDWSGSNPDDIPRPAHGWHLLCQLFDSFG